LVRSDISFTDGIVRVRGTGVATGFLVRCNPDASAGYFISITPATGVPAGSLYSFATSSSDFGHKLLARARTTDKYQPGDMNDVQVMVDGSRIVISVNGDEVVDHTVRVRKYASGGLALRCGKDNRTLIEKIEWQPEAGGAKK